MTPGRLDIEVPRNGSDARILQLMAEDEVGVDQPIDVTGYSFSAQARDVFGGSVIATATVTIDTAAEGKVALRWLGSQFDTYGNTFQACAASWDMKMVDGTGNPSVVLRGVLYITPEATA